MNLPVALLSAQPSILIVRIALRRGRRARVKDNRTLPVLTPPFVLSVAIGKTSLEVIYSSYTRSV